MEYYIQDKRQIVGNCMAWWKHNNCGYVCDIREAKVFTEEEVKKLESEDRGTKYRKWRKDYIDKRTVSHVRIDHLDLT